MRIEQLPDGFDYVLSQFFNPVAETHGRVSDLAFVNPFPERKDLHVRVTAESPLCHLVIIAGSVDVSAQYQTAVFRYNSFRLVAVFRHDLIGTLEGVPYSYFVLFHNAYDFNCYINELFMKRQELSFHRRRSRIPHTLA